MRESIFELNKRITLNIQYPKKVLLLGGSGSVGQQAFELCIAKPHKYKIQSIISGKNVQRTIEQIRIARPKYVVMASEAAAKAVQSEIGNTTILFGEEAKKYVIEKGHDIAITAIPGLSGLISTFDAIKHSKVVAFANKETIIYAGEMLLECAKQHNTAIIPIDSEHNAIFQILNTCNLELVEKIILTASGGPFLRREDLHNISIEDVLKHPTWSMGNKISVDCATLFNKALEVIEASYLFDKPLREIEAIIHPESIVHGIVQLKGGSMLMHASVPTMKLPISYALNWPYSEDICMPLNLTTVARLNFESIDHKKFPMFKLGVDTAEIGIIPRIVLNYANELAVKMFLNSQIKFSEIYDVVSFALGRFAPQNIENLNNFDLIKTICDSVKEIIKQKYL